MGNQNGHVTDDVT